MCQKNISGVANLKRLKIDDCDVLRDCLRLEKHVYDQWLNGWVFI